MCCFSWLFQTRKRSYATAPGKTTGEGSICSFAAWRGSGEAGKQGSGRGGACRGEAENRLSPAGCFFTPFLHLSSSSLTLLSVNVCCCTNVSLHTCVCVWHTHTHLQLPTEVCISQFPCPFWQANKDPLFLTGVTFPSDYPAGPETLVKMTVFDAKDKTQEPVSTEHLCHINVKLC